MIDRVSSRLNDGTKRVPTIQAMYGIGLQVCSKGAWSKTIQNGQPVVK
jgi:hypothetical protein